MATAQTPRKSRKPKPEFRTANLADDLLDLTLELTGKDANHTPRFPERFYGSYVQKIVDVALRIHECVIVANEDRWIGQGERYWLQCRAEAECVHLQHLARTAWRKGWISDKQQERWQNLIEQLRWSIYNWRESAG